jgi:cytochrome c-type biogenesis protein CcmH
MNKKTFFSILFLFSLLALAVAPVLAQGAETVTDDDVNEVAREIYCPVCESTPLDVCQTQACADWRELIRTKLAEGETQQEIFQYFADQYGDRVLARPPASGINLLVWLWPVVAFGAGAFIFSRYLRGLRAAAGEGGAAVEETAVSPETPADDDYAARIEQELQKK